MSESSSNNSRLFVGNLPLGIRKKELRLIFSRCGTVIDIFIPMKRDEHNKLTDECKGFAFVEMADAADAHLAIHMLDGSYGSHGEKIYVRLAKARVPLTQNQQS